MRERGRVLKIGRSARTRVRLTLWQTWPRDGKSSFRHNFEHFRASKYVGLAKTASAFSITVLEIISSLTCETQASQAGSGLKTHIIYQVQTRRPKSKERRSGGQVSPTPRKSGGVGRPLRRALGWPTGLRALRHAAAAPTRQEFELRKQYPSLAHRTTP